MDERTRSAIARLTDNEKTCLRRRLLPQTAKEMAIDLGVSPHAVEKRLKMARAKLGVSSSLAAARLLAIVEAGQSLVPSSMVLAAGLQGGQERGDAAWKGPARRFGLKGSLMIATACLFALVVQDAPAPPAGAASPPNERLQDVTIRRVGMNEAAAFIRGGFRAKDLDGSGYLEPAESAAMEPRDTGRDAALPPAPQAGTRDIAAERKWMAKLDTDRDGRVSEQEYVGYLLPWILWQGVPASWQPRAADRQGVVPRRR